MQRAERTIGEHRDALMDAYRQLRQEAITRELRDILAGFEAARQGLDADGAPLPDERSRAI